MTNFHLLVPAGLGIHGSVLLVVLSPAVLALVLAFLALGLEIFVTRWLAWKSKHPVAGTNLERIHATPEDFWIGAYKSHLLEATKTRTPADCN